MPLAFGGLFGAGGPVSGPSSASSSDATGGVIDTSQASDFVFSPGGSGVSNKTILLVGIAAAAAIALALFLRRK